MPVNPNRNYLFGMLIASLLIASADAENEDTIARCARIASTGDRILCLENALRRDSGDLQKNETPAPVAESVAEVAMATEKTIVSEVESAAEVAGSSPTDTDQFGLPEKQINPDPATSIDVVIVDVSKTAYGKLIFTTENGQVWLQTDKRTPRYKQLPVDMTIRDAASGSYFIQPRNGGIAVRVKRRQ